MSTSDSDGMGETPRGAGVPRALVEVTVKDYRGHYGITDAPVSRELELLLEGLLKTVPDDQYAALSLAVVEAFKSTGDKCYIGCPPANPAPLKTERWGGHTFLVCEHEDRHVTRLKV